MITNLFYDAIFYELVDRNKYITLFSHEFYNNISHFFLLFSLKMPPFCNPFDIFLNRIQPSKTTGLDS